MNKNMIKARWRILTKHGAELNRRVEIENVLLEMSAGKRPLPDAKTCRELAVKLGTPKEHWPQEFRPQPEVGNTGSAA